MSTGEGSRGGKVIGHSRSGKAEYAAHTTTAMGGGTPQGVNRAAPINRGGRSNERTERRTAADAHQPFNAGPSDPVHGGSGREPAATGKSSAASELAVKAGNLSYKARGGSADEHLAAAAAHDKAAAAVRGTIYHDSAAAHEGAAARHRLMAVSGKNEPGYQERRSGS